ncbi:efflux RND transporter periplasmic adaptor subunit [Candidatus Kaiserbacteria bacterium]|nr:efflux RND transporter periplasmic adaptor subunit [Candidatus Kaiserbacteria bacterium]
MTKLVHSRPFYIGVAVIVILSVILMAKGVSRHNDTTLITTTVDTGSVRELVSVSGIAEAEQTAELAFPVTGIVESVTVEVGDEIQAGDTLITLEAQAYYADRQDAQATLAQAIANRNELLNGPTNQARVVTNETVIAKKAALATTIENEEQKVANAYRTLLSSDLVAYSTNSNEDAVAPTISGTYDCLTEGVYNLKLFSSGAVSGYSFRLSGLENGVYSATVNQPAAFGNCGLQIQFDADSNYNNSEWEVFIPNTKSSSYVTNRNAHALAVTQAESAIALAEQALTLSESDAINQNAPARTEAIARADAAVASAQAKLSRINATIADRVLKAPFSGVITDIDVLPGETVTTAPVVTLLASGEFEVTARIPEIDIGKLEVGQKTEMVFDAKSDDIVTGKISFISLKSTEIDGVAYYEAIIQLDQIPTWMRSGLNADIEVIIKESTGSVRVPKRFVVETTTGHEVLVLRDGKVASTTIEVLLTGNDGFMSITGLNEGDIVVAP